MISAIITVIPLAIAKIVSPVPISVVITLLSRARGCRNASAYVAGWCGGTFVVTTLLFFSTEPPLFPWRPPPPVVGVLEWPIAAVFFYMALRQWRKPQSADLQAEGSSAA